MSQPNTQDQIKALFQSAISPIVGDLITPEQANSLYRQLFKHPGFVRAMRQPVFKGFYVIRSKRIKDKDDEDYEHETFLNDISQAYDRLAFTNQETGLATAFNLDATDTKPEDQTLCEVSTVDVFDQVANPSNPWCPIPTGLDRTLIAIQL